MQNTPISSTLLTPILNQTAVTSVDNFSKILMQKTPWEHLALSDEFLEQHLPLIAPENLALMLKDCDEETLPGILPRLSPTQLQAVLDFEVFKGDEIDQKSLAKWIQNLTQYCEYETLPETLDKIEHSILELPLARYARIELYDPENPPDPSEDLFYTPDFLFTIEFKKAQELEGEQAIATELKQALIELINKLCLAGPSYCRQFIENAYEMISAETLEEINRFRDARLSDYKLMSHQESIGYHSFLKPNVLKEQLWNHDQNKKTDGIETVSIDKIFTLHTPQQVPYSQNSRLKPLFESWNKNEFNISKLIKMRLAEASKDQELSLFAELERNICARWAYLDALSKEKKILDNAAHETFLIMNIGLDFLIDSNINNFSLVKKIPFNLLYRVGFYLVKEVILYAKSFEQAYNLKSFNQHYFLEAPLEQKIKVIGAINPSNLSAFIKLNINTWTELLSWREEIRYANLVFEIMFRRIPIHKVDLQAITDQKTNYEPALLTVYPLWITAFAQQLTTGQRSYEPLSRQSYGHFVSTYFAQNNIAEDTLTKLKQDIQQHFVIEDIPFPQAAERFFAQCLLLIEEDRLFWQKNARYHLSAPFSRSLVVTLK